MSTCYDKTELTPDKAIDEILKLRAQRDNLLVALQHCAFSLGAYIQQTGWNHGKLNLSEALAAIEKVQS